MQSLRRHLPWSLVLVLCITTAVSAEPTGTQGSEQAELCSSDEQSTSSEAETAESLICMSVRCSSEQDCWNACPGAISVSCNFNACSYQYSTGGGGGGGFCPSTRCIDDSDCVCQGQQGYCANRACTY